MDWHHDFDYTPGFPPLIDEGPSPGCLARVTPPEYNGTDIHHLVYLPHDWKPEGRYPLIVASTGDEDDSKIGSAKGAAVLRSLGARVDECEANGLRHSADVYAKYSEVLAAARDWLAARCEDR